MRFERLELTAFGKFAGETLEFPAAEGGLQVIYGDNEAGKSTTLRAIRSLLFGVPVQSSDTFVHAAKDIRIGAELSHGEQRLRVVRRKGRTNTLLTPEGDALDDQVLTPFLQGVDQTLFDSMFGLDHESLRQGAQALLALEGKLGATLFEAGFGTAHLRTLLHSLRQQAEDLFTARGRTKPINLEIARVRKARDLVTATATSPQAYLDLRGQLDQTQAALRALSDTRLALNRRKSEAELRLRLLPLVAQWRTYRQQRAELGDVPRLPPDAEGQVHAALRQLDTAQAQREQATRELVRVERDLAAQRVNAKLTSVSQGRMDALGERLGSARKAQADLPKRRAELAAVWDEVRRILVHLGYASDPERVEEYRLTRDEETQIRRLIRERTQGDAQLGTLEAKAKQYEASLQTLKRELAKVSDETNVRPLEAALIRAQKHVELEQALDRAKLEQDTCERQVAGLLSELRTSLLPSVRGETSGGGSTVSSADDLWLGQAPIGPDVVSEFGQRLDDLARQLERAEGELQQQRERVVELSHRVASIEQGGTVPSEEALAALRASRDALLVEIEVLAGGPGRPTRRTKTAETDERELTAEFTKLRQQIQACDDYAARLLHEAARVAEFRARKDALAEARQVETLRQERCSAVTLEQAETLRRWQALWEKTAFAVGSPRQMSAVLARVEELRGAEGKRRDASSQVRRLERELAAVVAELSAEMAQVGEPGRYLWESLAQFVARLDTVLQDRRGQNERRRKFVQRFELEREQLEQTHRDLAELKETGRGLRTEWPKVTKRLAVAKESGPQELQAALDGLSDLFRKVEEARGLERRISGIERDYDALERDVEVVVREVYDERPELQVLELLERTIEQHRVNTIAVREQQRLEREREERRKTLEQASFQVDSANQGLSRLLKMARAEDVDALLTTIAAASRARDLDRLGDEEERKIIAQGEGRGLTELVELCEGQNSGALQAERATAEEELASLDSRWEELTKQRVAFEQRLALLGEGAAKAAEELEAEVATLQGSVRKYLRLRVATTILEKEIEHYRDANQGPVLSRARVFFPRLTLGRYTGLTVGYSEQDEPILLCTTADGREVSVDGLSDGTRDQLYLSLRLATLLQYFESNAKMPWILDDVLVHFDDARAAAALTVLAEFSRETQVLFFTHHARTVELARQHLPAGLVMFHQLGRS